MTWTMAGYSLWNALFHSGANIILVSRGETEAGEMLDYCRFIHSQLPDFLKISKKHDQASLMSFPTAHSKIRALPATAEAGIGLGGATLIILDEFDFHDNDEQNYAEIKPMIDAGGQMVILSAPNKYDIDTKFKELWLKAKAKENNFYPLFFSYKVLPDRDGAWYQERRKEYDDWEMEGRYPRTEEEALSAPQLTQRFDVEAIKDLEKDICSPLREEYNGIVKIYKEPVMGRKYLFPIDPSEGEYDPSGGVVLDDSLEEMACFSGKIPIDEQARIAYDLYERYNNAYLAPERNAGGILLIEKLLNAGAKDIDFYHTAKDKAGWWTSSANRGVMIADLAEMIRLRQIKPRTQEFINQCRAFIRTKKKPDGEARKGCHDEFPIFWGIGIQARKKLPSGAMTMTSVKMREGGY